MFVAAGDGDRRGDGGGGPDQRSPAMQMLFPSPNHPSIPVD